MAASYTALAPPLQGEDMDISSPGQIDFDDDILLDDGDHRIEQQSLDERMLEGDDRPTTANDEEMSDEAQHTEVREEVMGDDAVVGEDEDLIDYSDDEEPQLQDEPVNDVPSQQEQDPAHIQGPATDSVSEALAQPSDSQPVENELHSVADVEAEEVDEDIKRDPELEQSEAGIITQPEQLEETTYVESEQPEQTSQHIEVGASDYIFNSPSPKQQDEAPHVESIGSVTDNVNHTEAHTPNPEGEEHKKHKDHDEHYVDPTEVRDEEEVEAPQKLKQVPELTTTDQLQQVPEAPGTPTDTGLHPVVLNYGDFEIPLFKSKHQPDGLLKDDNLASVSLAELMQNCRQRLASKLGEEISEDQEMILRFDSLACNLVENARPAFETSLNDILDVFLQLHHNDGVDDIPPFQLTLTHQLNFSSSLSAFKTAAAGGQGLSAFAYLYGNLEEHYEADGEQYEEQYYEDPAQQDESEANDEDQGEHGGYEEHDHQVGNEYDEGESVNNEEFQEYDDNDGQEGYEGSYEEHHQYEQDQSLLPIVQDAIEQQAEKQPLATDETHPQHPQESDDNNISSNDNPDHGLHEEYQQGNNGELQIDEINWDLDEPSLTDWGSDLSTDQKGSITDIPGHENTTAATLQDHNEDPVNPKESPTTGEDDDIDFTYKNDVETSNQINDEHEHVPEDAVDYEEGTKSTGSEEGLKHPPVEEEDKLQHEPSDAADGDGAEPAAEGAHFDNTHLPTSATLVDDEDTIDFDDDTQEEHARKESQAQANTHTASAGSPNGKRSFDEHAEDEIDLSSPDAKKARSR